MGACSLDDKPLPRLDGLLSKYAPTGVNQFAQKKNGKKALAYLCEGETVAILYDCNARIPLYAATVMTGDQVNDGYKRKAYDFRVSPNLEKEFQPDDNDYSLSSKRNICYESGMKIYVDKQWQEAKKLTGNNPRSLESPVHRGHLIAASYGRGIPHRIRASFTYTNSVPQFGTFNSGTWNSLCEQQLRQWTRNNCNTDKDSARIRLYIVVGAIPSTFPSSSPSTRFFGKAGFSDFEGSSNLKDTYGANTGGYSTPAGPNLYRVNVPRFMWTAACCSYAYVYEAKKGSKRQKITGIRSTAFYGKNEPTIGRPCETSVHDLSQLFSFLTGKILPINLFPSESSCYKSDNFVNLNSVKTD